MTIITERDTELVKIIEDEVNVRLEELKLDEDKVLEGLNKVSLARRMATMVGQLSVLSKFLIDTDCHPIWGTGDA